MGSKTFEGLETHPLIAAQGKSEKAVVEFRVSIANCRIGRKRRGVTWSNNVTGSKKPPNRIFADHR